MKKLKSIFFVSIIFLGLIIVLYYLFLNKNAEDIGINTNINKVDDLFAISLPDVFSESQIKRFNDQRDILKAKYDESDLDVDFWIGMGNLYKVAGDYNRSAKAYIESALIGPENSVSYVNLARLYDKEIKDYVMAEEYYKKAIENKPTDEWLYIDLGKVYKYRLDIPEKQEEILLEGEKVIENNINIIRELSRVYSDSGNVKKAIEYLEKVIKVNPNNESLKKELEELKNN